MKSYHNLLAFLANWGLMNLLFLGCRLWHSCPTPEDSNYTESEMVQEQQARAYGNRSIQASRSFMNYFPWLENF